jgi:hypothetical protein
MQQQQPSQLHPAAKERPLRLAFSQSWLCPARPNCANARLCPAVQIVPLLRHSKAAVRQAAVGFVAAAAAALPPADVYTQLRGMVLPQLAGVPIVLNGRLGAHHVPWTGLLLWFMECDCGRCLRTITV